jgi:two-component sensor histidine kinase
MILGAVVMTIVAATFSSFGRGPFAITQHSSPDASFMGLQSFLAALVASAIVPMAALAEKERTQRRLTRALDVARQAKHAAEQSTSQMRQVVKLQRLMVNELNHRVKNTLASVQSIASQTLRASGSMPEARNTLNARLTAMAGAHDILTRESWEGANLIDIVETAIGPYAGSGRIDISGPMVRLPPKAALAFSLTFHELCTNAAKYGALTAADGKVEVHWSLHGRTLHLDWVEKGGPPAREPDHRGFGTRMILGLGRELSGMANMAFTEAGLRCMIKASIEPAQVFGESGLDG